MSSEMGPENPQGLREFGIAQAAEAAQLRIRVRKLEQENAKLRRRLNRVHSSWTWRIGRTILFPYHVGLGVKERIARGR